MNAPNPKHANAPNEIQGLNAKNNVHPIRPRFPPPPEASLSPDPPRSKKSGKEGPLLEPAPGPRDLVEWTFLVLCRVERAPFLCGVLAALGTTPTRMVGVGTLIKVGDCDCGWATSPVGSELCISTS